MARYLVVAHETVTNPELLEQARTIMKEDEEAEFILLVPATPVRHLLFRRGTEQDAEAAARKLAEKAKSMFARKGIKVVDARVGAASPVDAVDAEMAANADYAGFVVSTLPKETSRWLRMDLPRTLRSRYSLPVYHVEAAPEWSAGDLP